VSVPPAVPGSVSATSKKMTALGCVSGLNAKVPEALPFEFVVRLAGCSGVLVHGRVVVGSLLMKVS
jgi:hypothetical protein